jgi:hypothetical protein
MPSIVRLASLAFLVLSTAGTAAAQSPTVTPTPGNLVRIELKPVTKTISVGEFANYTATGHYDNAVTKNLTSKLTYASSDPTVAVATNSTEAGEAKSRVEAVKPGVVTISAEDPVSGISTLDTGGVSGTLTVQGAVVSLALKPLEKNAIVGDTVNYTATATLSDGNTRNMTQRVTYASSDTSVAICPNAPPNKGAVQAVGVGTAVITATDPETDITTEAAASGTLTVRAPGEPTPSGGAATPTPAGTPGPPSCGDPDGSGDVTVVDGVTVLEEAAGLGSVCSTETCDVNGNGEVTIADGVLVLREAAGLGEGFACGD